MSMPPRNCILFVEKDRGLVEGFWNAFEDLATVYAVQVVASGAEAISYLKGIGKFSHRQEYPLPSVLVVGASDADYQAVEWIRSQPEFEWMRVVVLFDLEDEEMIKRAYEAGANSCLSRTEDLNELRDILGLVGKYWIECNQVPG
jgi:DNA-binding NarL/FixJ family response regulator